MIGIFYGSTMGTTESLAEKISEKLGVSSSDIHNVGSTNPDAVNAYDCILLGSSTWGCGDLQDDWYDFLDGLKQLSLAGKKVGLFGCGDGESYPDTFCDALGVIYDALAATGCSFIGAYVPEDYESTDSSVCRDGKFVGLAIDENNQSDKTDARVESWCQAIQSAL